MYYPIIHWHTTWKKNNFEGYAQTLDALQQKIQGSYLSNLFKNRVKQVYKLKTDEDAMALLRFGSTFNENGEFRKAFDNMFKEFETMKPFSTFNLSKESFNPSQIKKNADNIWKYLEGVEKGYNQIAEFLGGTDIKAFYSAIAKKKDVQELREYFNNLAEKDKAYIMYAERFKELDAAAQGKLRSIAQYFNQIQTANTATNIPDLAKALRSKSGGVKLSKAIVNNINAGIRQIMGFGWEYLIGQSNDVVEKTLGVKVEHYGDTIHSKDEQFEYSRVTTDIRFKGNVGYMKLTIPLGASVKLVKDNGRNMLHLSIKNSTTLGKMFDILNNTLGFMNDDEYEAFANIAANFRRRTVKSSTKIYNEKRNISRRENKVYSKKAYQSDNLNFEYKNMNKLLPALNKVLMITGLAGSLTANDLSTIIIVNNKILNIYDLLGELGKSNNFERIQTRRGLTFGELMKVSGEHHYLTEIAETPNPEDQKKRSDLINQKLQSLSLNLGLNLGQQLLKDLTKS